MSSQPFPIQKFFALLLSTLLLPAFISNSPMAEQLPAVISVSASGKATAAPDQATLSLRFVSTELEAHNARKKVDAQVGDLIELLEDYAIKDNSLDTSQTRIHPQYDYRNNERVFRGYQFVRNASFVLENLQQIDSLLEKLSKIGIDQLNHIEFGLSKPNKVRNQAMNRAVAKAKKTAQKLAQGFDVALGKIHSVSFHSEADEPPARPMLMKMEMASADASSTYQQKDLEFTSHIQVAFTFE